MAEAARPRVAVVTGANRGMGLETCRQLARGGLRVVLCARDAGRARDAAHLLAVEGLDVDTHPLDVADADSVRALRVAMDQRYGGVDVLVNNAGVYPDEGRSVLHVEPDLVRETMETNFCGPLLLCQAFVPGMARRGWGRVVNVSSGLGQMATMGDFAPGYSASKAALNALTRMVASAVEGRGVKVNAADPGWVRTDMGGPSAPRSAAQGAETIVWLATLPDDGPSGGFFRDRRPIPW